MVFTNFVIGLLLWTHAVSHKQLENKMPLMLLVGGGIKIMTSGSQLFDNGGQYYVENKLVA